MGTSHPKMEASAAGLEAHRAEPRRRPPATPGAEDPFRLGFRERRVTTLDGRRVLAQIPLTAEDLVYPQEGDHVTRGMPHFSFLHPQADAMRRYLEKRPGIVVTSDVTLVLRHDGKNCGPDVAVIEGDFDPSAIAGAIHLREIGGRLAFALEAVSTSEREIEDKDLEKNLERYAREGVAEYFTLYPVLGRRVKDLVGRRLERGGYVEIAPDAERRVYSQQLGLLFQIDAGSEELVVIDAGTGQRLLISDEEEARADAAEARAGEAEARAGEAEERAEQQAEARRQEAEARRQAEERVEQEAAARRQEAEARRQAEERLRANVEDLCGLLGIEWTAERSTAVRGMGTAQLEALWADLMSQKRWP